MKKALLKDSFKQIKKTYKRFVSILLMALLGVGFFAGIRSSSPDMKATIDKYFDDHNVYDIQVLSNLALTENDLTALSKIEGVENVYGTYSEDVMIHFEDEEVVVKVLQASEKINTPNMVEGEMPKASNECVIDDEMALYKDVSIGDYIEIEEQLEEDDTNEQNMVEGENEEDNTKKDEVATNEDDEIEKTADSEDEANSDDEEKPNFKEKKLKVVGIAKSPLYISRDKGSTTLGSGKISYILYVHEENIESDIYTEAYATVKDAKTLNTISDKYDEKIDEVKDNIEKIKEERQNARYEDLIQEANIKLEDAQKELDKEKAEAEEKIAEAEQEIADGKKEIADGEKEINDAEKDLQEGKDTADKEFKDAEGKLATAEVQLKQGQEELNIAKAKFETQKAEANQGISQIDAGISEIDAKLAELKENKELAESVLGAIQEINQTQANIQAYIALLEAQIAGGATNSAELLLQVEEYKKTLADLEIQKQELKQYGITEDQVAQINQGIQACEAQRKELVTQKQNIQNQLQEGEKQLNNSQAEIDAGNHQIQLSKITLAEEKNKAAKEFMKAEEEIAEAKRDLAEAKQELADGEQELNEKKIEFETEIADAEEKLLDAREKINDIENGKWYILDRYGNAGFNGYSQDTENIARLGEVFPIVFFLIAILISLTTMTRMVEEERVQIGTLKALGYNKSQIMSKYVMYSVLATIIGGVIGIAVGITFLPNVIITMYQMMYNFNEVVIEFNLYYSAIGMGSMLVCIVGATIYTASKELNSTPAELMRPKAPKPGKRVFLEKIPFIWKHLSFTQKVTIRNMFRYKKKFFMTVIGICGCTALILAGFGLKDSISKIMDYQYIDIYNYDMMIALKNTLTDEEIVSVKNELENNEKIKECMPVYITSVEAANKALNENAKNKLEETVQIFVPNDTEKLKEYIRLKDLETGEILDFDENTVIITDKLSQLIDAKIGDEIILKDSDKNEYTAKVGGIVEHYISHYVYMTEELYNKTFNEEISSNVLLAQYAKEYTEQEEEELSEEILKNSKTASITLTSELMKTMNDTLSALNTVVYILIICAGVLAFVVLYNLTNINISERIRELATIKVLGFYDKEVFDYVTREIVLLTIIGILIGLVFGFALNSFILGTCEIGMLRFKRMILPQSYVFAILITVVFTVIVNYVTYFSLKKIDMIEALKSVE